MSRLFVTSREKTSELRFDPKHIEEVGGGLREVDAFGLIGEREVSVSYPDRGEVFEDGVLRAPVKKVWSSHLSLLSFSIDFLNSHDPIRVGIWQPSQHDAVDDAEDRSARADAETESDYRDRGERRAFEYSTKCKLKIFQYGFHYSYLRATNGSIRVARRAGR